ncbi:MAG: rhomboid family intramembrane serine protease [Bacteroidota bacterium]
MMKYSYQQPSNPLEEIKNFFRQGSSLSVLIIVNVALWIFIQSLKVILFIYNDPDGATTNTMVLQLLAIPASVPALMAKPWTLLTYMFLHIDIWHLLFNMVWLYWFGRIFLEFLSSRQLILVYLLGGIAGALVYVFAFNTFPVFSGIVKLSFALGASASVMAIVTAISFYLPNYTIQLFLFGKIRILYLAIILFVFDFFMIPSGNAGGHLAHIGGALFGVIFSQFIRVTKNASYANENSSAFFAGIKDKFQKKQQAYNPHPEYSRTVSDEDYNKKKKENQKKVDDILEKISKGGYDCLTKAEKEFLFKTSYKR